MRNRFPHPGHGEANRNARLRDVEAEEIRAARRVYGVTLRQLGRDYGVSAPQVLDIVRGKSYKQP